MLYVLVKLVTQAGLKLKLTIEACVVLGLAMKAEV